MHDRLRRFRLAFGNVPVLSIAVFHWQVLRGSIVHDFAMTKRAASRRLPDARAKVARV